MYVVLRSSAEREDAHSLGCECIVLACEECGSCTRPDVEANAEEDAAMRAAAARLDALPDGGSEDDLDAEVHALMVMRGQPYTLTVFTAHNARHAGTNPALLVYPEGDADWVRVERIDGRGDAWVRTPNGSLVCVLDDGVTYESANGSTQEV